MGWNERWRIWMTSMVLHLVGVILMTVLGRSLGLDLDPLTLGWIRSAVLVVTLVPISLSGLGLREGAFAVLLVPLGVKGEQAVALSLLVFGTTQVVPGLAGGIVEAIGFIQRRSGD